MDPKKIQRTRETLEALLGGLAGAERRTGAATSAPARTPVPRWKDGTAIDPIAALEETLDEERFAVDPAYQSQHLEEMARLTELREERRKNTPPPPPPEDASLLEKVAHPSGQAVYEQNKERLQIDEKARRLDEEIAELRRKRAVLGG